MARGEIQRPFGFEEFTTTTPIDNDQLIVSTELGNRWTQDDYFNGWFAIVRGGNNAQAVRRVNDYAASPGTVTVGGAALADEAAAQSTCEISLFHPDDVIRAFNKARQEAWPQIAIVRDYQSLVTGPRQFTYIVPSTVRRIDRVYLGNRDAATVIAENLFKNAGFEDWISGAADNWTLTGIGATDDEEEQTTAPLNYAVLQDGSSARILSASSGTTEFTQTVTPSVAIEHVEANMSIWVYCLTATRVSPYLSDVSGLTTGTPHTGTGWELLTHTYDTASTATTITGGIQVSAGSAIVCYVDEAMITLGPSEALDRQWTALTGWHHTAPVDGASDGGTLRFRVGLPVKRRLRLVGTDLVSSVSAEADTIELDGDLLEPLYNLTRSYLCKERARVGSSKQAEWQKQADRYLGKYLAAINQGTVVKRQKSMVKNPYGDY